MRAEELRIGNTILYKMVEINLTADDFAEFDKNLLLLANPIPLIDEWLIKCGFKVVNSLLTFGNFEIGLDGDDFIKCQKTVRFKRSIYIKIKYVHQFQNLYFALEGKELEYEN